MQNDLISRSGLIDILKKWADANAERGYDTAYDMVQEFIEVVKERPTAYDVESVDKQILDYFKGQIDKKPDGWDVVDFSADIRNIVRNGWKE